MDSAISLLESPRDHLRHLLAQEMGIKEETLSDPIINRMIRNGLASFLDENLETRAIQLDNEIREEIELWSGHF